MQLSRSTRGTTAPALADQCLWRTCFPNATVVNLSGRSAIDDLVVWEGIQKVYLCGAHAELSPLALARLGKATIELVVEGEYNLTPVGVESLIRDGCDVRVLHSEGQSEACDKIGLLNRLAYRCDL